MLQPANHSIKWLKKKYVSTEIWNIALSLHHMAPCTAMTTGSSESLSLLDTVIVQYILTLCKLQHLDSGNDSSLHIQGIHGYLFSS